MSPSASELLFESEAALRMVDSAIGELHPDTPDAPDAPDASARPRARTSHLLGKLEEVSTLSELATLDILDGLDGALVLVDELDVIATAEGSSPRANEIRRILRDALFGMLRHLQFQDITTQQLAYASSVIRQMEDRLTNLVTLLGPPAATTASVPTAMSPMGEAFDPHASVNSPEAQVRVDEPLRARS